MSEYADRLDPDTYTDDPLVSVYRDDPGDGLWVPERVFWRLVHVAKGYSLHLLPLLGDADPIRLSKPMIQTLIDEVHFVLDRLQDPVLELWADQIIEIAQATLRQPGDDVYLTVEGE
jgi:hypothetical protein